MSVGSSGQDAIEIDATGAGRARASASSAAAVTCSADARTREQLEWLADDVLAADGTAGVWLARPTSIAQERELAATLAGARATEYRELIAQCRAATDGDPAERARALRRLRGEWRAIGRRDFFPPPEREQAAAALRHLEATTRTEPVR